MTTTTSTFKRRSNKLSNLVKRYGKAISFVEEADFGAGCEKQINKIKQVSVLSNKVIVTTGTNINKAKRIFGTDDYAYHFRGYHSHVLMDEERKDKAVKINWHILNNNHMVQELGISSREMENFSYMLEVDNDKLREETWFRQVISYLFDKEHRDNLSQREMYKKDFIDEDAATMIFTTGKKECHECLKVLIEKVLGYDKVLVKIINGDFTTNADAEKEAKEVIKDANGKRVFFIASMMASRSFSIPQIKNIILFVNSGEYSTIYQKIARGLTPWIENHTVCNIIDFRLSYKCCADIYLSGEAIKEYDTNKNVAQTKSQDIAGSDKICFYEYFTSDKDFMRRLDLNDIKMMIESHEFVKNQVITCYNDIKNGIVDPRSSFNINGDKLDMKSLFGQNYNNIKGDSNKKCSKDADGNTDGNADGTSRTKKVEDPKARHLAWLLDNYKVFNTGSYNDDEWLYKEITLNMNIQAIQDLEHHFNIDMNTISEMVIKIHDNGILLK